MCAKTLTASRCSTPPPPLLFNPGGNTAVIIYSFALHVIFQISRLPKRYHSVVLYFQLLLSNYKKKVSEQPSFDKCCRRFCSQGRKLPCILDTYLPLAKVNTTVAVCYQHLLLSETMFYRTLRLICTTHVIQPRFTTCRDTLPTFKEQLLSGAEVSHLYSQHSNTPAAVGLSQ